MFDIGFWELIFVAVIALLVLGPERLPGAIRSVSRTFTNIKQTVNSVKSEINHELRVHELHEQLKQAEQKSMHNLNSRESDALAELKSAADDVSTALHSSQPKTSENTNDK